MCSLIHKSFALVLVSLPLLLNACTDKACEVVGSSCERACDAGTYPICVAVGLCECSIMMAGGIMNGGVMNGGMMTTGGNIEPPPTCAPPSPGALILNEALVDPNGMEPQEEFIELVNLSDQEVDLSGITLAYEGNPKRVFTQGCMAAKSAVALFSEHTLTQWSTPPRAVAFQALPQFTLTNSRDASLELYDATFQPLSVLFIPAALIKPGISATRSPELSGEPALHSEVSETHASTSPARCNNLGTFELDCMDGQVPSGGMDGGMTPGGMTPGGMTPGGMTPGGMTPGGMTPGGMGGNMMPPLEGDPFGMIINEIDYDTPNADTLEFIEIKNNGSMRTSLAGLKLEFINGSGDRVYETIDLAQAGEALDPGTFLIVGSAGVIDNLLIGIPSIQLSEAIQNGPDGIRLTFQDQLVDELGYGGYAALSKMAQEEDSDAPGISLSLCPSGFIQAQNSPARDNECIP